MPLLLHTSVLECPPLLSAHISMTLADSTFSRKPIPTLSHQPIGTFASTRHWPSPILSVTINNCPLLFPSNILDTFRPGLGVLIFWCYTFLPFYIVHGVLVARTLEWFAILEWMTFIRTLHYDPVCLGWPCTSWLIALLSYSSPFTSTRQWSMKGIIPRYYTG